MIFLSLLCAFPSSFFPVDFCFAGCILFLPMFLLSFSSSIPTFGHCASWAWPTLFSQSRDTLTLLQPQAPRALHASRVGVCVHVALSLSAFQVSVRDLLSAPYPVTG